MGRSNPKGANALCYEPPSVGSRQGDRDNIYQKEISGLEYKNACPQIDRAAVLTAIAWCRRRAKSTDASPGQLVNSYSWIGDNLLSIPGDGPFPIDVPSFFFGIIVPKINLGARW